MSFLSVISHKLKGLAIASRSDSSQQSIPVKLETGIAAEYEDVSQITIAALQRKVPVTLIHGRAGTGKTTLIRRLINETNLNYAIVAPTGVAALNAGGQTIHSFFRLPPRMINLDEIHPDNRLKSILRRLDFLVVDEVSMVRADLLDAVDRILQVNRTDRRAFGGVPILLVGDFLQLPPVVEKADAQILKSRGYQTHFAFGAKCLEGLELNLIELTTVYRQQELAFIELLGQLRVGENVHEVIDSLNRSCHRPHRAVATPVTLTARTSTADHYNLSGLESLPGKVTTYTGRIEGDFQLKDKRLPAPEFLDLKPGARVMFVKNDSGHRWVNGSLGTVTRLEVDSVFVRLDESQIEYPATTASWESIRYEWDNETKRIQASVIGTYSQIPLTLAWATTIHKAQGLTLSDVRIDLGAGAFSEGQTYVALSRAKSMDGLSFANPLTPGDVQVDPDLVNGINLLINRSCRVPHS